MRRGSSLTERVVSWYLLEVFLNVVRNVRQFSDVFLQKALHGFNVHAFEQAPSQPHWSIDGEAHVFTIHFRAELPDPPACS